MKGKTQKEKNPKPKYNMGQNSWFMIKLAWTSREKKVLVLGLLSAILAVALNLVNLYVSPTILSAVERHAPVSELLLTIAGFVLGIMLVSAASTYVNANTLYGRISVRCEIINLLNRRENNVVHILRDRLVLNRNNLTMQAAFDFQTSW